MALILNSGKCLQRLISFFLIIYVIGLYFSGCNYQERKRLKIERENRLQLTDIKLRIIKEGRDDLKLFADYLEYDRDNQVIDINNGRFEKNIKFRTDIENLKAGFKSGTYNLRSGIFNINDVEGILIDKNVRMKLYKIVLSNSTGDIGSENEVIIRGNNFEFEGGGFSGNIKDGVYFFKDGITARIFNL